ncbi:MAG TPA: kelch repeat-containing protein [Planctomycetota bacterium]|nr:kelch repeat-containing protein [Planctomycetota bacterium]
MRFVLSFGLLAAAAAGQATWLPQSPPMRPTARESHNLVHDPATQRTFLFWGLQNGAPASGPFWMWDGSTWTPATPATTGFLFTWGLGGLCEDGAGAMLLFGGYRPGFGIGGGTPTVLDETWRVQASAAGTLQFLLLSPATRPAARQAPGMVRTNQGVLLFGGTNVYGSSFLGDTWLWNGSTWANVSPPVGPTARAFHSMAFDSTRNVVVLFGGSTSSGSTSNDTWEFDGTIWQQRLPLHQPSPRSRAAFVFSPAVGKTLLSGGELNGGTAGEVWAWNGVDWLQVASAGTLPAARRGAAFAYDAQRQQPFLFGGRDPVSHFDDSYYLDVQFAPSTYTPFGAGCLGPTGLVPSLAPLAGEVPALGSTSHLRVTNLPLRLTLPIFVLGTSNTFEPSPGHPLPLDLGFLGWPGCEQLVSHDVFDAVPTLTGEATLPFAVPFVVGLIGFTFHAQVLVLYQPSGAAVSNALTGVVGL